MKIPERQAGRTIAIGDIHGCSIALKSLIKAINPQPQDIIIALGDYVDRGFDSSGVIEELIALKTRCKLVCVLGNHDQMMLQCMRVSKNSIGGWNAAALPALIPTATLGDLT